MSGDGESTGESPHEPSPEPLPNPIGKGFPDEAPGSGEEESADGSFRLFTHSFADREQKQRPVIEDQTPAEQQKSAANQESSPKQERAEPPAATQTAEPAQQRSEDPFNRSSQMAQQALGLVETKGLIALIEASDAMLKAANVQMIGWDKVGSGLVTTFIVGDVAAVKAAVDAGAAAAGKIGQVVGVHIIPRPHDELVAMMPKKKAAKA